MTGRATTLQRAMAEQGFDAVLLTAPASFAYVSGFHATPYERLIALVVPREGPLRLVCPSLEEEAARAAAPAAETFVWRDEDGPAAQLERALRDVGGRLGIEKRHLTVASYELVRAVRPDGSLEACDELLARLRAVKSERELELLRRAARVVDAVVQRIGAEARPGRSEAELAAECALELRAEGGDSLPFDPLILSGPSAALPHGEPGSRKLERGDLLIVDIGAACEGYCADITRTFVVGGEPDARQRELYALVLAAHDAGVEAARAGARGRDVDAAARSVIEGAGLGARFVHRTGHGLGLEAHEPPYLTATSDERLEPGMVVTVEPGVYVEGWGGIRIEDDLVVRDGDPELLTRAPTGLD